jgi:AbrB family looped-hinge helix DNA binding protein
MSVAGITMSIIERPLHPFTSSVTRKGQVTIPASIRRLLGVGPHDKAVFVVESGKVELAAATSVVERTAGLLAGEQPALDPEVERAATEEAIAAEAIERGGGWR